MPTRTSRDEIVEGTLTCGRCHNRYFIQKGALYHVPEDVPRDRIMDENERRPEGQNRIP